MADTPPPKPRNGKTRPTTTKVRSGITRTVSFVSRKSSAFLAKDEALNTAKKSAVLAGNMNDLPPVSSNIIRIFLSSTFSDMKNERDKLMEFTFPKLKKYSMDKHGLQFQVVDMRWGVRDEATDDHMTTQLCLKELEACQKISEGPNFIAVIGQRYGYRPIPTAINEKYFNRICEFSSRDDQELLHKWYKLDENVTFPGPMYTQLPISAVYRHYLNPRNDNLRMDAMTQWQRDSNRLTQIMHKVSEIMVERGKLPKKVAHQLNMSVTEREVWHGCLNPTVKNIEDSCLVFLRTISNLEELTPSKDPSAWSFKDIKDDGTDDVEAKELLNDLRERLQGHLPKDNLVVLEPCEWQKGGNITKHLENFVTTFESKLKSMIDKSMQHRKTDTDPLYNEVLRHLTMCLKISSKFKGREDLVSQIKNFLEVRMMTNPLLVYGNSGSGKTSLMAKSFHMASKEIQSANSSTHPVCIIRFLGTSQFSSSLIPLIKGLCQQICTLYKKPFPLYADVNQLTTFFKKLISEISTEKRPLYIFLDSLDQLSSADGAHELSWIPSVLPQNVKLVISFALLPDLDLLTKSKQLVQNHKDSLIQVPQLGEELGFEMLKCHLAALKRKLTEDQQNIVQNALKNCNMPLFVSLISEEVSRWKSYDPQNSTVLADTIHASIKFLFQRLEMKHGEVFVRQALRFITAAKHGVTENELDDLLSLDEDVLNDVYQYHLPPATMRRIPPLLWARLRSDMESYITEQEADGTSVIYWYHRQFITCARNRYFENQNGNVKGRIHSNMADYFLGKWHGVRKPFKYTERQMKLNPPSREDAVDRQVAEQPLIFRDTAGGTRYNFRKLNEMPYHLIRAGNRIDDLYNNVLFNIEWIATKTKAVSVTEVIADYVDALAKKENPSLRLVHDALKLGLFAINQCPEMVVQEITSRLLPYYKHNEHKRIQQLIVQCDDKGLNSNALIPLVHSNHTPGGPLMHMLEGHPWAPTSVTIIEAEATLVSASNMIMSWDITTGEYLSRIKIPEFTGVLRYMSVSPDATTAVACSQVNEVFLFNLLTNKFQRLPKLEDCEHPIRGTCISNEKIWLFNRDTLYTLDLSGNCLDVQKRSNENESLVQINLMPSSEPCFINRTGQLDDDQDISEENEKCNDKEGSQNPLNGLEDGFYVEFPGSKMPAFTCKGPLCFTDDFSALYACQSGQPDPEEAQNYNPARYDPVNIMRHKYANNTWTEDGTIGRSAELLTAITLSQCKQWLAGTIMYGFLVFNLKTQDKTEVNLPTDQRNLPSKTGTSELLCFSNCSTKMAAAVRKAIYVWDLNDLSKEPKRLPSIHYKRIISLVSVPAAFGNKIISSSFDHSINVWNLDNLKGITFTVEKHDSIIEDIVLSTNNQHALTMSQKVMKVWDLYTGQCKVTINTNLSNSKVNTALINSDGTRIVSADSTIHATFNDMVVTAQETGFFHVWEAENGSKKIECAQTGIKHLLFIDREKMVLAVSQEGHNSGLGVCRSIASGKTEYQFVFESSKFLKCCLVGNKLVVPAKNGKLDILKVYHARTGSEQQPSIPIVCGTFQDVKDMKCLNNSASSVIIVRSEKASIYDIKTKKFIKSIPNWNGSSNASGTLGLQSKITGELNIISISSGAVQKTLLPGGLEYRIKPEAFFTADDKYVLFLTGNGHAVVLVRLEDATVIGKYYSKAKISSFAISPTSNVIVIGKEDGRYHSLLISDPNNPNTASQIANLPSRAGTKISFKEAVIMTKIKRAVNESRTSSRLCIIS